MKGIRGTNETARYSIPGEDTEESLRAEVFLVSSKVTFHAVKRLKTESHIGLQR